MTYLQSFKPPAAGVADRRPQARSSLWEDTVKKSITGNLDFETPDEGRRLHGDTFGISGLWQCRTSQLERSDNTDVDRSDFQGFAQR